MATEEELRDAEIEKTKAEAALAAEHLLELQRKSHISRRIGQGIGVGIVLALAGMALFGPIKDTIEAESKLASLNATIADRTNVDLQQRLDDRQEQLDLQAERFRVDLAKLADDVRRANNERDRAIQRSETLAANEKELAEKYAELADQVDNKPEFLAAAAAANMRARDLQAELAKLRQESDTAAKQWADLRSRVRFSQVQILVGPALVSHPASAGLTGTTVDFLEHRGMDAFYSAVPCRLLPRGIYYYSDEYRTFAADLSTALLEFEELAYEVFVQPANPGAPAYPKSLWVCVGPKQPTTPGG